MTAALPTIVIAEIEIRLVSVPMHRPHRFAGGTLVDRTLVVIRLTAEGHHGWGEAAPVPGYTTETADEVWEALAATGRRIVGTAPGHPADLAAEASPALPPTGRHAVESAAWDLWGRVTGRPAATLLGGAPAAVPVAAVLGPIDDPDAAAAAARDLLRSGYPRVKVKVDGLADLPALAALSAALPPGTLRADANGSLPPDRADVVAIRLAEMALDYVEQPFPPDALDASAAVAASVPVCLDETVTDAVAAQRAVRAGAGSILAIKPGRVGGPTPALEVAGLAEAGPVRLLVGGLLESGIGRAASVALATAARFTEPAELAPPTDYLAHDVVVDPLRVRAGSVSVPRDAPGFGFTVDDDALDRVTVRSSTLRP